MVEKALYYILQSLYYKKSNFRSVVYNLREQVVLEMLRNDVLQETLNAQIEKFSDNDRTVDGPSKSLLTPSSSVHLLRHILDLHWELPWIINTEYDISTAKDMINNVDL